MRTLTALALAFTITNASAQEVRSLIGHYVLPPLEYDKPFPGKIETWIISDLKRLRELCPTPLNNALGCARRHSAEFCLIILATDEVITSRGWTPKIIIRHERGHCSGWTADHPGARLAKPEDF